jgi:S-adenosylmethionine hydrolase
MSGANREKEKMPGPLITLTTDFGTGSPYVAAMKGAILSVNPAARLLDLSHEITPQNVRQTAFFLASALPYFPADVLHVVVVDPGVGSDRAILYVEAAGRRLLAPDNGCWTSLEAGDEVPRVIRLNEPRFWRQPVSATFHGRDIFAPVAGHLSLGVPPDALGTRTTEWVRLEEKIPREVEGGVDGEVVFVDPFGNLITNIPGTTLGPPDRFRVWVGETEVVYWVRSYAEADAGTVVALISSTGSLEIAVVQGSAVEQLGQGVGAAVRVRWSA